MSAEAHDPRYHDSRIHVRYESRCPECERDCDEYYVLYCIGVHRSPQHISHACAWFETCCRLCGSAEAKQILLEMIPEARGNYLAFGAVRPWIGPEPVNPPRGKG